MREILRVPAETGLKITIKTLEPAEYRVVMVVNSIKQSFYDEIMFIKKSKVLMTDYFPAETSVILIINPVDGKSVFKFTVGHLRKRRRGQMPFQRYSNIRRGGNSQNQGSAEAGNFLVQAADNNSYVLQTGTGNGKILLNG